MKETKDRELLERDKHIKLKNLNENYTAQALQHKKQSIAKIKNSVLSYPWGLVITIHSHNLK